MEVRWYGTATLSFTLEGHTVLFDPFLMLNPQLKVVTAEELAALGDIFITHTHFDHFMHASQIAIAGKRQVYCPPEGVQQLREHGLTDDCIHSLSPGQVIEQGPFIIRVLASEHIQFDWPLVARTFFNWRAAAKLGNLYRLLNIHRHYQSRQTLGYTIEAEGKIILHLGSLGLAVHEEYPTEPDVMTLPYQGRSDLEAYALSLVERIRPHSLFLHHFDDAFPPVSSTIDPTQFLARIQKVYPHLPVYVPQYRELYII